MAIQDLIFVVYILMAKEIEFLVMPQTIIGHSLVILL
jgi:hypothetical protein